ncbi:PTS sugar transporter subunit IIA [Clostridium baratii]|uniref:PTS sugar transporter subunit IIA n=1 Tax=Clostridium baratii TaxID=1561 RepID=UPI00097FA975|nr:PTS sugar transporter subunit IIA [Clostridium baratii]AQM58911.1 hypothetical protein NPD11_529 [Clostridium baratii]MBS6042410.1 PTS sugar transporter subunit IIA [Clostridium baratii]
MYEVLVVSHSTLAKGFNEAVNMILGSEINYLGLDDDGVEIFHKRLKEKIEAIKDKNKKVLILADLFGGTPFNKALYEASSDSEVKVISGINLPMLIEAIMREKSNIDEVALEIVESTKDSIKIGIIQNNNEEDE